MPAHSTTPRTCRTCDVDISERYYRARYCVSCAEERRKEQDNTRQREKRATDPEYRERDNARQRERWATDPEYRERALAYKRREWRPSPIQRDRMNEDARKRYRDDPEYRERRRESQRLRKPWDSTVTRESVANLLASQRGRCNVCKASIRKAYHLDHIMPQSKGGASTLENLQLLCAACNLRKHARLVYFPPDGGQGHLALGV